MTDVRISRLPLKVPAWLVREAWVGGSLSVNVAASLSSALVESLCRAAGASVAWSSETALAATVRY
ncbi:hypothetical protein [Kineosporia babensis]|uniref:Uncharacterized protein n=1 Tax=Kineosporia babensis TaxID=499548 RepID=A0A9X1ND79_9ACTN|nr:hypothetical protein [Kineosporia babensis]MCD5311960.1 hypothetical protein [Kineosporia babensis]